MNSGLMTNSPNDSCTVKMNRLSAVGCKDTMSFGSQLEVIVHLTCRVAEFTPSMEKISFKIIISPSLLHQWSNRIEMFLLLKVVIKNLYY